MQNRGVFLVAVVFSLIASTASGGWFTAVVRDVKCGYRRNQCWPEPFNYLDQQAVRTPFALMVQNGWQRQNIIPEHYHQPGTGKLNEVGRHHVERILTQTHATKRMLYVRPATTTHETVARIEAVRAFAQRYVADGMPVQVLPASVLHGNSFRIPLKRAHVDIEKNRSSQILPTSREANDRDQP